MRSTVEVGVACGSHSLVPKEEDWPTILILMVSNGTNRLLKLAYTIL